MRISIPLLLVSCVYLSSCSVKKFIPEGQGLYVGAKVKVTPDSLSKPNVSGVEDGLEGLLKPVPNKTLFGMPWKVWWYYVIGEPKDEGGLKSWFRKKLGEPPVIATQRVADINAANMVAYLDNEGYYRSQAKGRLILHDDRTAEVEYDAYVMPRYFINSVKFVVPDSSDFNKNLVKTAQNTFLKKKDPVRIDIISAERSRIETELKTRGYYYFNPDNLIIKVDSTIGRVDSTMSRQQVNLYVELKPQTVQAALKQYYINRIFVNTGTRDDGSADSVTYANTSTRFRRGITVSDPGKRYKRRIFYDAIGFRSGNMYTSTMYNVSMARLFNLQNFKIVKSRFEVVPRSDSAMLNAYYDLAPLKKRALQTSITGSTKSNNLGGGQLDVSWKNRNFFKGAEILTVTAYVGFDLQIRGKTSTNVGNEYIRYGGRADLTFPRFIIPFFKIRPEKSELLPKTILSVNYENRIQRGLYTTTSIRGDWSYVWSKSSKLEQTLTPISINFVEPRNINLEKLAEILRDPDTNPLDVYRYSKILDSKYFIAGSAYNITFRPTPKPFGKDQWMLSGGLEWGGNILSLLAKKNKDTTQPKVFLGVPIFQYAKFDTEVRYTRTLTPGIKWANRFLGGVVLPYGNSKDMITPQFKQYFAGGSTGIRAFRPRAVGPGGYFQDSTSVAQLGYQALGDIRLEMNTELRFKLSDLFNFAVFVDAGNVWSVPPVERTGYDSSAVFTKQFFKQLAVGGGIGLRMDFSFLIFRLDVATPFRKPWLAYQTIPSENIDDPVRYKNPWVFNEINLGSRSWRKQNLVLNIAVGLPF